MPGIIYSPRYYIDIGPHVFPTKKYQLIVDSLLARGTVRPDDIVEAVSATLPAAPTFRRRIVRVPLDLDYPYWIEDEHFDLEYHMRHLALPKPGDWKQFRAQVARLVARPLDLTRPPWELTVIDGLDGIEGLPPGCFANVLKVHHAAIDGVAGVELFSAWFSGAAYARHRHDTYAVGVTDRGVQVFDYRGSAHASRAGRWLTAAGAASTWAVGSIRS